MVDSISLRSGIATLVLAFGLTLLISSAVLVAADTNDGELSVPDAVETPPQTVYVNDLNEEFEVDAFTTVVAGDSLDVDATVANDNSFQIYFYDKEMNTIDDRRDSSDSKSFETDSLEPGTYVLALFVDGDYVDIFPVVVEGYDVTVDAPNEVSLDDETFSVTADITETALEETPSGIEIAVWNDDTQLHKSAVEQSDGQYESTFTTSDLAEGTYSVSAAAQGTATISGMSEVLGVSDTQSLSVSDSNGDDSQSGGGIPDDSDDDSQSEPDDDNSEADDESDESDETDESDDENDSTEQNDDDGSEETDDGGVQQPNLEDESDDSGDSDESASDDAESDDSDAVPLVGPVAIAAAALVAGLLARVCRQ